MSGEGTYKCEFDEETQAKALRELNEDPKQRASQIETLRQWVKSQPHLRSRTDDHFLLRFLRTAKFSQLRAQQLLDNFWTARSSPEKGVPEWFQSLDPLDPTMSELLDLGVNFPLPGRDSEGRKIIVVRAGSYDAKKFKLADILKLGFMNQDIMLMDEVSQVHGFILIQDFSEYSASHVLLWSRETMSKAMRCWQDVYPSRNKGSHFCKMPTIVNGIFEIGKFFMKEKSKKRMQIHSSWESLHKVIDKSILPDELGGTAGPMEKMRQEWKEEVLRNKEEIYNLNNYGVDESKRPAPPAKTEKGGILGSFRKLSVD